MHDADDAVECRADGGVLAGEVLIERSQRAACVRLVAIGEGPPAARARPERPGGSGHFYRRMMRAMSNIERLRVPEYLPEPMSQYTDGVLADGWLYVSGIIAVDKEGKLVG